MYNGFLSAVDMVNLDPGFILSFVCVLSTDFYDRLLLATICPAIGLGLLALTYRVARRRNIVSEEVTVT